MTAFLLVAEVRARLKWMVPVPLHHEDQSILVDGRLNFADSRGGVMSTPVGPGASGDTYIPPVMSRPTAPFASAGSFLPAFK